MTRQRNIPPIAKLILLVCLPFSLLSQSSKVFSKQEIESDIIYLKNELVNKHPNIYLYNDYNLFHNKYDSVLNSIGDSSTTFEAFSTISSISSIIRDNHTVFIPDEETFIAAFNTAMLFPLKTKWNGTNLTVINNCTDKSNVPIGCSIVSINGMEISELIDYMRLRWPADGYNTTYFNYSVNSNFPIMYFSLFGSFKTFNINYVKNDSVVTIKLDGETMPSMKEFQPCSNYYKNELTDSTGPYLNIRIDSLEQNSFMKVGVFEDDLISKYGQNFNKTISAYFHLVNNYKVDTLVIDVRNNLGGTSINMQELLSYLFDEPVKIKHADYVVDRKRGDDLDKRLKEQRITNKGILNPKKKSYKGTLIVLANGGTCSAAAIFTSAIKAYNRGLIVGEETGGSKAIITGSPIEQVILPNTKIKVLIPTRRIQILEPPKNYEGVKPDIRIDLPESLHTASELINLINN
ncbi:S41 family peptidase [Parvicella tangerina]|uniref:Tail specific protease domain-containing protein n=1 Tax=Parvicella tangerina TaxID=2829795 RepID=A0A916JJA5_9FLAO|nr:S41 family peptidase [Parvicella tangerina]CAG5076669.1 hypothetical protein CRYO30217_00168 [Parvicella tangerina]